MTTLVAFQPTAFAPFSFIATLDSKQYTISVTWNLFGQRWYFNVVDQGGNAVVSEGLNPSPAPISIASLSWGVDGLVTAVCAAPHGFLVGATANLTVSGCAPAAYNGAPVAAYVEDAFTLFWPVMQNPGPATQLGAVSFDLNLVDQYFETSTVVYRESTQNFEINP